MKSAWILGAFIAGAIQAFAVPAFADGDSAGGVTVAAADAGDPGFLGSAGSAEKEAKVHGHEEGLVERPGITGNWGGLRDTLEENGITIEMVYTGELASNFSGGALNRTGSLYHDNLDITLTLDTGAAGLWSGGTLFVYGLRNHGGDPTGETIGDVQAASNIEAPDQFIVHEAWFNQDFADGAVSLLAGLHDLNSEFMVTNYGSLFINSSFGIQPDISGNVPLSIFPQAGLGGRLRIKPAESVYLQAAVYDGDPSTREVYPSEGNLIITEAGLETDGSSYKIGYWSHSAEKVYGEETFDGDFGYYGIIDQALVEFDNEAHSSIGVFLQYGWVPSDRNDITGYIGGGVHLHGLIPTRDVDDLGFAVAHANTHLDAETAYELTYRLVVAPWLSVQPSFQWIKNPGGDATFPMAQVGFLRFEAQL
ncbi:MAG: carbohydrate porin [Nitrospinae bacterium]|nr:carbohydrate porin [Nitrospinota bacterium]